MPPRSSTHSRNFNFSGRSPGGANRRAHGHDLFPYWFFPARTGPAWCGLPCLVTVFISQKYLGACAPAISDAGFFDLGWRDSWSVFQRACLDNRNSLPIFRISAPCSRSLLSRAGVLILRYREPDRAPRPLSAPPGGPLAPIVTIFTCLLLMAGLPIMNWDSASLSG